MYDTTGHVMIQIAKTPQLARITGEQRQALGDEDLRDMLDGYFAYFGTYTIDEARQVVIHHVEADMRREFTGTDQERPFTLSGDELRIGDGKTWLRRLVRVPNRTSAAFVTPSNAHALHKTGA